MKKGITFFTLLLAFSIFLSTPNTASAQKQCTSSADCQSTEECITKTERDGLLGIKRCYAKAGQCKQDSQCPPNNRCVTGNCVPSNLNQTSKSCTKDSDCGTGGRCANSKCFIPQSTNSTQQTGGNTNFQFVNPLGGTTELPTVLARVIQFLMGFVGIIAFFVIVYAGIIYMTSTGNDSRIKQAKSILTYGIVGLIVSLAAYLIVTVVINAIT